MHVGLADVFVRGVVGYESDATLVELSVKRLIVVGDAGKQRGPRLIAILAGKPGVGQCGLKWRAVLPGPRESIFQCKPDGWRRRRRSLLRTTAGRGARGRRRLLGRGNPCAGQQ